MNDTALMQKVKNGNLDCMRELFEAYNKRLYNFFLRLTNDRMLSEDLAQNVFYRALKYRHTFKTEEGFRPWVFQIARNVFYDHQKKNKIQQNEHVEISSVRESEQAIDESIIANEQKAMLMHALGNLSPPERELIELHRFQKLKYEEIAKLTGSTTSAVKMKTHRVMKKLKLLVSCEW